MNSITTSRLDGYGCGFILFLHQTSILKQYCEQVNTNIEIT